MAYWIANRKRLAAETLGRAEEQASRILRDAERDADSRRKESLIEGRERAHELRLEADQYARDHRQQIAGMEHLLAKRESAVIEQQQAVDERDRALAAETMRSPPGRQARVNASRLDALVARHRQELERIGGLSADEARETLIKQLEADARREAATLVKRIDTEAREQAADRAKAIITQAIQRSAADHTIETTVTVVDLPSDDMKGRIIGREGRNIRALELATGVDLIVDDTPGAIILSGFDPFRREVAGRSIERLIADGRIHPARIEEVVEKVTAEMDDVVRRDGEAAAFELGLHDLDAEVLRLMGRLQFRTSYGQNILNHSKEVAFLAGVMARELGLNAHVSVRAAFLHDIGKAIDRDLHGSHLELGLDFLRKHGESEPVLQAVAAHHMDIDWPSLEAMIVQAADAISAARPGARRDLLETYVKRLERLEGIADSFKGVSKSFALQAGREIRIMVESEKVTDDEAVWLSKDIARRIESELEYPGQIKVTVIRETRSVDYAKYRPATRTAAAGSTRVCSPQPKSVVRDLGEHALIARIREKLGPSPAWLLVDVGDDAAVYEPARNLVEVITTDAVVDGVHFDRRFVPARAIGHRALAVNLSDLAAMGATPRLATLSLVLPPDLALDDFDEIIDGLLALATESRTRIVGGNITSTTGPLAVDVTLIGAAHRRRRADARRGTSGR